MTLSHISAESALKNLSGLKVVSAAYAGNMREFGFAELQRNGTEVESEWALHIQCSWRIESDQGIVTGSFDWYEPAEKGFDPGPEWDPATGGSLQDVKLRDLFRDTDKSKKVLKNHTGLLVVEDAEVDQYGGLLIRLTGGFRLRVFPAGCRGESWRAFKRGDLDSHYVCESAP